MSFPFTQGEDAAQLDSAQRRAIHELRGEPGEDGWRAAGLLAAAHAVPRFAASPNEGPWQPTGDYMLCFFVDLLELGGSASVLLTRETLAALSPDTLVDNLKQTAHALLALHKSRG